MIKKDITHISVILIFILALSGCGKKPAPVLPVAPKVTVVQPIRRTVTDSLEAVGTSQAQNSVQLVARVPGYLDKVLFTDGQIVSKGQLLFIIQQDAYRAKLDQAQGQVLAQQAQLQFAQKQFVRYSNLLAEKAAAQSDVDNWRYQRTSSLANLKIALANRELAKLDLSYTEVVAPFSGRIDRRLKDEGNLVGAGENTVLTQLSQIDPIYVYFSISDADLARLMDSMQRLPGVSERKEWPLFASLVNEEGYPHHGIIDFSATAINSTTGTLLMRGVFSNPDEKILPGSYMRIRIPLKQKAALLLPDSAVSFDQQGSYVLVVGDKNVVEHRMVKPSELEDDLRVIDNGLKPDDWVIIKGLLRAIPGQQVNPERKDISQVTP